MGDVKMYLVLGNFLQQIAYIVVYITLLDECMVFTKFLYLQLASQRPLWNPESISCIFFNLKGLGRRTLTEQCRPSYNKNKHLHNGNSIYSS